jgi:flagellar basal-body rod protein FlgC
VGILNVLKVAGSALTAERLRMDVTSSNIANAESTRTPQGTPYRRSRVVFSVANGADPAQLRGASSQGARPAGGVYVSAIVQDDRPPRRVQDPSHPDADAEGFVSYPNVDLVTEMTDMLEASRAYEANVTVINVAKNMAQRALDIGRG